MKVGEIIPGKGPIVINAGRPTTVIKVKNLSDHPVQVTSHYHFFEANRRLLFDRRKAFGMRLDIAAGAAVRFEPGEEREVTLIPFEGAREVWGFSGLVNGPISPQTREVALRRALQLGFAHEES